MMIATVIDIVMWIILALAALGIVTLIVIISYILYQKIRDIRSDDDV